jgi:NMD protein affecting ribosome stability and mRNA decay
MIIYEETQKTEYIPVQITCDRCKAVLEDYEQPVKIRHSFGYGTEYDQSRVEFELCEKCLIEILKKEQIDYHTYDPGQTRICL